MKAIVATNNQNIIGSDNTIPWTCKPDMNWFRKCTLNHIVVMGSNTFASIGKPLPNRYNIVLTSQTNSLYQFSGPETEPTVLVHLNPMYTNRDLSDVLKEIGTRMKKEVWVCGGVSVYRQLIRFCETVFISRIPPSYYIPYNIENGVRFDSCAGTHILAGMHSVADVSIETWAINRGTRTAVNQGGYDPDLDRLMYAL